MVFFRNSALDLMLHFRYISCVYWFGLVWFEFKLHPIALEIVSSSTFLGELVRAELEEEETQTAKPNRTNAHFVCLCVRVWVGILNNKFFFVVFFASELICLTHLMRE